MAPPGAARVTFWLVLAGSILSISAAPQSPNAISRDWATYNMQRQNVRIGSQVSLLTAECRFLLCTGTDTLAAAVACVGSVTCQATRCSQQ
jgi:hypothetical protein